MSIILRLQNLPWTATSADIRKFFHGVSIPDGGVHIVGGELGDVFIAFSNDEDARRAFRLTNQPLCGSKVTLMLSSKAEMMEVITKSRAAAQKDVFSTPAPATVSQAPAAVPDNRSALSSSSSAAGYGYQDPNDPYSERQPEMSAPASRSTVADYSYGNYQYGASQQYDEQAYGSQAYGSRQATEPSAGAGGSSSSSVRAASEGMQQPSASGQPRDPYALGGDVLGAPPAPGRSAEPQEEPPRHDRSRWDRDPSQWQRGPSVRDNEARDQSTSRQDARPSRSVSHDRDRSREREASKDRGHVRDRSRDRDVAQRFEERSRDNRPDSRQSSHSSSIQGIDAALEALRQAQANSDTASNPDSPLDRNNRRAPLLDSPNVDKPDPTKTKRESSQDPHSSRFEPIDPYSSQDSYEWQQQYDRQGPSLGQTATATQGYEQDQTQNGRSSRWGPPKDASDPTVGKPSDTPGTGAAQYQMDGQGQFGQGQFGQGQASGRPDVASRQPFYQGQMPNEPREAEGYGMDQDQSYDRQQQWLQPGRDQNDQFDRSGRGPRQDQPESSGRPSDRRDMNERSRFDSPHDRSPMPPDARRSRFDQPDDRAPMQPDLRSRFDQSDDRSPKLPEARSRFDQSGDSAPMQPESSSRFNKPDDRSPKPPDARRSRFDQSDDRALMQPEERKSRFDQPGDRASMPPKATMSRFDQPPEARSRFDQPGDRPPMPHEERMSRFDQPGDRPPMPNEEKSRFDQPDDRAPMQPEARRSRFDQQPSDRVPIPPEARRSRFDQTPEERSRFDQKPSDRAPMQPDARSSRFDQPDTRAQVPPGVNQGRGLLGDYPPDLNRREPLLGTPTGAATEPAVNKPKSLLDMPEIKPTKEMPLYDKPDPSWGPREEDPRHGRQQSPAMPPPGRDRPLQSRPGLLEEPPYDKLQDHNLDKERDQPFGRQGFPGDQPPDRYPQNRDDPYNRRDPYGARDDDFRNNRGRFEDRSNRDDPYFQGETDQSVDQRRRGLLMTPEGGGFGEPAAPQGGFVPDRPSKRDSPDEDFVSMAWPPTEDHEESGKNGNSSRNQASLLGDAPGMPHQDMDMDSTRFDMDRFGPNSGDRHGGPPRDKEGWFGSEPYDMNRRDRGPFDMDRRGQGSFDMDRPGLPFDAQGVPPYNMDSRGPMDNMGRGNEPYGMDRPGPRDMDSRGPSYDMNRRGPQDMDRHGPPSDFGRGGPKDMDRRGPPNDFGRSGPQDMDRHGPPSDFGRGGSQDSDRRGPGRDFDRSGPQQDMGGFGPFNMGGPSQDMDRRGPPQDMDRRGPPDMNRRGPSLDINRQGPPSDIDRRGPPSDIDRRGPPSDMGRRGPPQDMDRRGQPQDMDRRGPPDMDRRGPPSDMDRRGPPSDMDRRGPPHEMSRQGPQGMDPHGGPSYDMDRRGPPQHDMGRNGPPQDLDRRGPPPLFMDNRGPPQGNMDRRGPPPDMNTGPVDMDIDSPPAGPGMPGLLPTAVVQGQQSERGLLETPKERVVQGQPLQRGLLETPKESKIEKPASDNKGNSKEEQAYMKLTGLPFQVTIREVVNFLTGVNFVRDGIRLGRDKFDKRNGEGYVKLRFIQDLPDAMKKDKHYMGRRCIQITQCSEDDWRNAGEPSETNKPPIFSPGRRSRSPSLKSSASLPLRKSPTRRGRSPPRSAARERSPRSRSRGQSPSRPKGSSPGRSNRGHVGRGRRSRSRSPVRDSTTCLELKGLPLDVKEKDITDFLRGIAVVPNSIFIECGEDGKPKGNAYARLANQRDMRSALDKDGRSIGRKRISIRDVPTKIMQAKVGEIQRLARVAALKDKKPEPESKKEEKKPQQSLQKTPQQNLQKAPQQSLQKAPQQNVQKAPQPGIQKAPVKEESKNKTKNEPSKTLPAKQEAAKKPPPQSAKEEKTKPAAQVAKPLMSLPAAQTKQAPKEQQQKQQQQPTQQKPQQQQGLLPPPNMQQQKEAPPAQSGTGVPKETDVNARSCIHVRNLPYHVSETEVLTFFKDLDIVPPGLVFMLNPDGSPSGQSYMALSSNTEAVKAGERRTGLIRGRKIVISLVPRKSMLQAIGMGQTLSQPPERPVPVQQEPGPPSLLGGPPSGPGFQRQNHNGNQGPPARPPLIPESPQSPDGRHPIPLPPLQVLIEQKRIVEATNLPFDLPVGGVVELFQKHNVIPESVRFKNGPGGRPTGAAIAAFATPQDALKAVDDIANRVVEGRTGSSRVVRLRFLNHI